MRQSCSHLGVPQGPTAGPQQRRQGPMPAPAAGQLTKTSWRCRTCSRDCFPIRSESRCLCGHRLKEHTAPGASGFADCRCVDVFSHGRLEPGRHQRALCRCSRQGCRCTAFFYIVAEGAWVLRCRCKHKHTEHDPVSYRCSKAKCGCAAFDSPWVCNCNHAWGDHIQARVCSVQGSCGPTPGLAQSVAALRRWLSSTRAGRCRSACWRRWPPWARRSINGTASYAAWTRLHWSRQQPSRTQSALRQLMASVAADAAGALTLRLGRPEQRLKSLSRPKLQANRSAVWCSPGAACCWECCLGAQPCACWSPRPASTTGAPKSCFDSRARSGSEGPRPCRRGGDPSGSLAG